MKRVLFILFLLFSLPAHALDIGSDCGGAPDGSDTTPAWNSCVALAQSGSDKTITFGPGTYDFDSQPDPITDDGITIQGTGPWTTTLLRTYSSGNTDPFIELRGRGSTIEHLQIATDTGTSGGYGLYIVTSNSLPAGGKHHIRHVRIASTLDANGLHSGMWRTSLYLDGAARTTAPPIHMRGVKLYDVEVFDASLWLVVWWGTIVCDWYGGGAYQGGGTAKGIAVGGAGSQKNRIDADIWWAQSSIAPGSMRGPGK